MAAPGAPSSVTVTGNGTAVFVYWTAADSTETHFHVELSTDDGSSWGAVHRAPAGVNCFAVCDPAQSSNHKARVTAINADGSSSTTTSSALAVGVAAEAAGTDIYLILGENVHGPTCLNVSALTTAGASPIANLTDIAEIVEHVQNTPKWDFGNRNLSPGAIPLTSAAALAWNHVGIQRAISTITPNSPIAGQTAITLASGHGRPTGMQFRTRVLASGTSLDGVRVLAEVTGSTTLKLIGVVASASASTGTLDLPSVDAYDQKTRGNVDPNTDGSAYPSTVWGPEAAILARAQDARGLFGDNTGRTSILLKCAKGVQLCSRLVGSSSSAKRWSAQWTGKSFSHWDEFLAQMDDMRGFLDNLGTVTGPPPFRIAGVLISTGYNEIASDFTALRNTLTISSISVVSGVARVTTSSAHGLSNATGKLYNLGVLTGIGGTMSTIADKHHPVSVVSSTQLDVLDFDATGLSATLSSASQIEVGAPVYFFEDLVSQHVDDVREAAIAAFDSTQDPDEVPVVLMEPSQDPYYVQLQTLLGSATQPITTLLYEIERTALRSVAGAKVGVSPLPTSDIAHRSNAVVLTDEIYFGAEGVIQIGDRAFDLFISPSAAATGETRPCVVAYALGDSYVNGSTAYLMGQVGNPEMVAPVIEQANGHGAPIPWAKVWNHSTAAVEVAVADHTQFTSFGGLSNLATNALFQVGLTGAAGIHIPMFRELRTMFPDHDIVLFQLGVNGSTAAAHTTSIVGGAKIASVSPGASTVTITLETAANGGQRLYRTAPLRVTLSGITGLTPEINGSHVATPTSVSTNPLTPGTQTFTIPVASVTGTAGVSSARADVPQGIWDPDAADIWPELQDQINAFHAGLVEAGYRPDARFVFVSLGTNDQALNTGTAEYQAAIGRILEGIREECSTRAKPREELGVVFLEPIVHGRSTITSATTRLYQTALRNAISGDTRAVTLNVDESADRIADPVTISYDRVHPDVNGYVNLGLRAVRAATEIGTWDAAPDADAGGSGTGGAVEV